MVAPGAGRLGAWFASAFLAAACAGAGAPAPSVAPVASASGRIHAVNAVSADAKTLRDYPAARAEELLAGRFPGVQVVQLGNGDLSIRIRGETSIYGTNQPLYVVDGMPLPAGEGLLALDPNDIARIEVLRDIGDTALYGVRGANGVVLITTKHP